MSSGTRSLAAGPLLAWAYLVVAGSLVGFTAYAWLLRAAPISLVVTSTSVAEPSGGEEIVSILRKN